MKSILSLRFALALGILVVFAVLPAKGQVLSDLERSRSNAASYYNYSEPADVTVMVNVWGTVRNPGLYEIPDHTTLSRLLSLSGGPIVSSRQRRSSRTIEVRLFRRQASGPELKYEIHMEDEVVAMGEDPVLLDGDVVTVETVVRQRIGWRDVFPVIAAVGTIAIAIERLSR